MTCKVNISNPNFLVSVYICTGGMNKAPNMTCSPCHPALWRLCEPYPFVAFLEDLVLLDHPPSLVGQAVLQQLLGHLGAQGLWVAQLGQEWGQEVNFLFNLLLALLLVGAHLGEEVLVVVVLRMMITMNMMFLIIIIRVIIGWESLVLFIQQLQ